MRRPLMRALILALWLLSSLLTSTRCFRTVCVYTNRAIFGSFAGSLNPEDIDTSLCTHIVYSYASIKDFRIQPAQWNDENSPWRSGMYSNLVNLKKRNSNLKVLLALGHIIGGTPALLNAIRNEQTKKLVSSNVAEFIRQRQFDGIHLEWSQLGIQRSRLYYNVQYLKLVKAFRSAFDDVSKQTNSKLILTVSLPAIRKEIDETLVATLTYPPPNNKVNVIRELISVVDFVTIRTIDMQPPGDTRVGLTSPLFSHTDAKLGDKYLSVDWVVKYYESLGIPPAKINIGISTYGRTFKLANRNHSRIGDASLGHGAPGKWSNTPGILGYYELCGILRDSGTIHNVASQAGRYFVNGDLWISYDDIYSITQKVCYMKGKGIGGLTFWTLEMDDSTGIGCGRGRFPLITTAVNTLLNADMSLCAPKAKHIFVDVPNPPAGRITTARPRNFEELRSKRIVCYVNNWAHYRRGKGRFLPENIDPNICTHVVYAYAWIRNNVISPVRPQEEESENWREGMYQRVVQMKKVNSGLKVILAVGGYSAGNAGFENVSKNPETRKAFSTHAVRFLQERKFDGLEVDWQFVTPDFKLNNLLFLQALRFEFDEDARTTGRQRLLLTVALPSGKKHIDEGYGDGIESLIKFTDFVSLLTYDFHGSWDVHTGFHSALYASLEDTGEERNLNVDWVVRYYVSLGVPKDLINIGIATYGRSFTLMDTHNTFVGAQVMRTGEPGTYTNQPGLLAFYEICDLIAAGGKVVRDRERKGIFVYKDYQWIGFEDVDTVTDKACYVMDGGYGGVVVWSLDYDDFTGASCYAGKYPLMTIINLILDDPNLKVCPSYMAHRAVSGTCRLRPGSSLLYLSLLLLWPVADFSLT